jgi:hypothetical protein
MQATLDAEYGRTSIGFSWIGSEEMDEVSGDGRAELLENGSIGIEFEYHKGDEAVLICHDLALAKLVSSPCGVAAMASSTFNSTRRDG